MVDSRFGVAELGASDMSILGFPLDGRYHSHHWDRIEHTDSAVFLHSAHREDKPSRHLWRWCAGSYKFAGRFDYCHGGQMATETEWADWAALEMWLKPVYIVGNELTMENPIGDDVTASEYAVWYHDVWTTIKSIQPSALIAPYGPIGCAEGRAMAEQMWDAYITLYGEPLPVDFYPLHWYPWYSSWDGSQLAAEIAALEAHIAWIESHRGTKWAGPPEYWLTEYGLPTWEYEISEASLLLFMQQFTDYLMTNTVNIVSWAWWPAGEAALVVDGERTALGDCYYNLAIGLPCE